MSRRGRGADGRNGGSDGYGRDGHPAGVRRIGLGRGRHRVGRHRADLADRRHRADGRHDVRRITTEPAAGWPEVGPVELERVAMVPSEVLAALVAEHGRCLWEVTSGDPPDLPEPVTPGPMTAGPASVDREFAARQCAGCPVQVECVAVELRTAGANTVGVWGGLAEDDRRALHAARSARTRPGGSSSDEQEQRPATADFEEQDGGGW